MRNSICQFNVSAPEQRCFFEVLGGGEGYSERERLITFPEVNADELQLAGIIDILRTPTVDDAHPDIPWSKVVGVTVGVTAMMTPAGVAERMLPHIRVHLKDFHRSYMDFSAYYQEDGTYEVATVSGAQAPHAPIGEQRSQLLSELFIKSLDGPPASKSTE
ncbi:MAG: hypothetical protein ACYDA2_04210 [Acidimicrobiales bacterium]